MSSEATRGHFIVIDGPDGSGKSTQTRLLADRLLSAGIDVECVRDPGGTVVSEKIRELLLDPSVPDMDTVTEMFLYMASRTEMVDQIIRPAIEEGRTVLCDRFVSSTIVYQGVVGGVDIDGILAAGHLACGKIWPDLTLLLDIPASHSTKRMNRKHDRMELKGITKQKTRAKALPLFPGAALDRQEILEYRARIAEGFRNLAASAPKHYVQLDGRGSVEEVAERIWKVVERVLR